MVGEQHTREQVKPVTDKPKQEVNYVDENETDNLSKMNENTEEAEDDNEGVPTDTGWAWVICLCVFLNMLIIIGFNRSLSILFVDIVDEFQEPATVITLMFTVHALSGSIASVVISNLVMPRFSVRIVSVAAAICSAVSTVLISVAPNIVIFLMLFILKGSSFGTLLVGPMSLIGHYFKKRRSLASSIANAGFCVAYITFPPITEFLRSQYGFRGSLLVVAAIEMNVIAFAMLLRPPNSYKRIHAARMKKQQQIEAMKARLFTPIFKGSSNGTPTPQIKVTSLGLVDSTDVELEDDRNKVVMETNGRLKVQGGRDTDIQVKECGSLGKNKHNHNGHLQSPTEPKKQWRLESNKLDADLADGAEEMLLEKLNSGDSLDVNEAFRQRSVSDAKYAKMSKPGKNSLTNSGSPPLFSSLHNLDKKSTSPNDGLKLSDVDLSTQRKSSLRFISQLSVISVAELPYVPAVEEEDDTSDGESKKKKMGNCSLSKVIDLSLFKIWLFAMIAIFVPLGAFSNYLFIYMPAIAFTTGISKPEAAIVMTISGVMDLVTRIISGYIGDFRCVSKTKMVAASTVVISIICHCARFFNTYTLFLVFGILIGMFGGFRQNFLNVMLLDCVGVEKIAKAHGLCVMLATLLMSVNHPIIGAMLDATGNFVVPLHYVGVMVFLASLVLMCEPLFRRLDEKRLAKERAEKMNHQLEEGQDASIPLKQ